MTCRDSFYNDCCLLTNITFKAERISFLLERRFQRNSTRTSFDFKAFLPEKPSTDAKVSRSFLRIHPTSNAHSTDDDLLPDSAPASPSPADFDTDDIQSNANADDNEKLEQLYDWVPGQHQATTNVDSAEEEEETVDSDLSPTVTEEARVNLTDEIQELTATEVEDVHVTFVHVHLKTEPTATEDPPFRLPQLDGQNDLLSTDSSTPCQRADQFGVSRRSTTTSSIKTNKPTHPDSTINGPSKPKTRAPLLLSFSETPPDWHRSSSSKGKESMRNRSSLSNRISNFEWKYIPVLEEDIENGQQSRRRRRQTTLSSSSTVSRKIPPLIVPHISRSGKRKPLFQSSNIKTDGSSPSKRKAPLERPGRTILDYFEVIKRSKKEHNDTTISPTNRPRSSNPPQKQKPKRRSEHYFDGCIVLDDDDDKPKTPIETEDDVQEVEKSRCLFPSDVRQREKLLNNIVRSSVMRIKWLTNLEFLLLEHISICHKEKVRSINRSYPELNQSLVKCEPEEIASSYSIHVSLISLITENFLKLFMVRESLEEQQELMFSQFGLTSHLRYLFLELASVTHENDVHCRSCTEYASILDRLLDVLFDVIDLDLCERHSPKNYRSSLFKDDYFHRPVPMKSTKTKPFFRLKLLLYLIELISVQRNRCSIPRPFSYHRSEEVLFQWIEDTIQHIVRHSSDDSSNDERMSICFNVMELCLILVEKKITRIKRMAVFLAKTVENYPSYLHVFLFDQNLLADIRMLLINEIISKRFHIKLTSIGEIDQFFSHIQTMLTTSCSIDESTLLLLRSLFSTYADLVIDNQHITLMCSTLSAQITLTLRRHLDSVHSTLVNLSENSSDLHLIKRMVVFSRLLQSKWKQF